jgi:hypothetical protein
MLLRTLILRLLRALICLVIVNALIHLTSLQLAEKKASRNFIKLDLKNLPNPSDLENYNDFINELKLKELLLNDGISEEAKQFMEELGLKNVGDNGEKTFLPANLSNAIRQRIKEGYETDKFNSFLSNMISLNRRHPDLRHEYCKKKVYSNNLPKCTIFIPFCNENWMTLLRTVHSVLINSPLHLIEEILLIDGASNRGND